MNVDDYRKAYAKELDQAGAGQGGAGTMALRNLSGSGRTGSLDAQIAVLGDRSQPSQDRLQAMREIQSATFLGPVFDPYRASYANALRIAATDESLPLRQAALELLAHDKDDYALRLLAEGIERVGPALIPDAKAIQLLSNDDHGVAVLLARRLVHASGDLQTRIEAVRVLSTDPASAAVLQNLLDDQSEAGEIRSISAAGLRLIDPQAFEASAGRIASDPAEPDDVRASCFGALARGQKYDRATQPRDLVLAAEYASTRQSGQLRAAAARFLSGRVR